MRMGETRSDRDVNIQVGMHVLLGRLLKLGGDMGFLSRLLVPRGVRRAMHPVRAVKRAATQRW